MQSKNKVAFYTLGCKLNYSESSTIAKIFIENNFSVVKFNEVADVYVINSCSVTSNAEKKSRNAVRRAKTKNSNAIIIFTGCYAQINSESIKKIGVDYIFGSNDKDKITDIINKINKQNSPLIIKSEYKEMKNFVGAFSVGERTRSFLKIQDGCDNFCSYCIIPIARGPSRSTAISEIISQAKEIAKSGIKEIVLTGVNLGEFGKNRNENFLDLLKELIKINGLERFRIGSIEPNLLHNEIIDFIAEERKIMPHFHIPLQSGSDEMLKLMNRHYTTNFFREKIDYIKKIIPNSFIGIDLITSVNGETEKLFQESYEFVESLDISFIHQFQYSERPNTRALTFSPKVSPEEKQKRSDLINNLSAEKHKIFLSKNINEKANVLFEATKKANLIYGFTENYIKVETNYDKKLINKIVPVKLISFSNEETIKIELL